MGNTETSLNNSRDILADLGERLATLERQIDQNRVDLVEAKNLSSVAREVTNIVENVRKIKRCVLIPSHLAIVLLQISIISNMYHKINVIDSYGMLYVRIQLLLNKSTLNSEMKPW